ncbi:MAG: superoxide dismutase [Bacteroidia bacterium]|nr:superoxide dismutase [Bacteroidia bacterium]
MSFSLSSLPYQYDALEPYVDARTMEIHHSKHHNAYITNLNNALEAHPQLQQQDLATLVSDIQALPESIRTAVRNNGGGHWNHTFFWSILTPTSTKKPVGKLASAIDYTFGSFESLQDKFTKAAMGRFGSGWAWLIRKPNGELVITSTPNQDSPIMNIAEVGGTPILGLDVWEHAYYLNYQNRRADYVNAWWNIVNWEAAENLFAAKS